VAIATFATIVNPALYTPRATLIRHWYEIMFGTEAFWNNSVYPVPYFPVTKFCEIF